MKTFNQILTEKLIHDKFPEKFYIVTKPTKNDGFEDIFIESDIKTLFQLVNGGLKYKELILITTDKNLAMKKAKSLV